MAQQGLEKYNDITTKMYFRSTNHIGDHAFEQIMQKQNRLEYLRDHINHVLQHNLLDLQANWT